MQAREDQQPSTKDLINNLTREMGDLVQEEINLAKTELEQKAMRAAAGAGLIAAGGALGYAGFLAFVEVPIALLARAMPRWLAASITAAAFGSAGGYIALKGMQSLREADLVPHETIQSVKEDATWLKSQTH